jgi:hypothetical protein
MLLASADYFHLGGSDLEVLGKVLLTILIPIYLYLRLFGRSELFAGSLPGPDPIPYLRKLLHHQPSVSRFFEAPLGMAVGFLVFGTLTVLLIAFFGVTGPVPTLIGACSP